MFWVEGTLARPARLRYGADDFWGPFGVTGRHNSAVARLILVCAAVLLLAVAGCGRKGALDLPPSAAAPSPATSNTAAAPPTDTPFSLFGGQPDEKPQATPGPKKRIILDPILD